MRLMKARPCNHTVAGGFTLFELLAVTAVVVLLAATLFPALGAALESAQMSQSMSNLRQLAVANMNYAADHGRFCPAEDRWNNKRWHGARSSASAPFDPAKGFLAEYLGKSRRVGICPLFRDMVPGTRSFEISTGGYGYNASYIGGTPAGSYDAQGIRVASAPAKVLRVDTVMFTTSGYATGESIQEYPYCEPPFWDFGWGPSGMRPSPTVHFRFRGAALVAWCDGRVTAERLDPREVGDNPHGGDAVAHDLGWFGPDDENGCWNPGRTLSFESR